MKYIILLIFILILSCNNEKKEIAKVVEYWQNKTIIIPDTLWQTSSGSAIELNSTKSKYIILNYIDTSGCSACKMRLYEWELLKQEAFALNLNVDFLFVIYSKDYREIEKELQTNQSTIPVIYDSLDIISTINKMPKIALLQTFLLDNHKKVILMGNPLDRKKLWQLYLNTIMNEPS